MDQSQFVLAKTIQWDFPDTYGEDEFVIIFGGFHIKLTVFKILGNWIKGSGWTNGNVHFEKGS